MPRHATPGSPKAGHFLAVSEDLPGDGSAKRGLDNPAADVNIPEIRCADMDDKEGAAQSGPRVVQGRKGSMVTIDQIPHIIQDSLQNYLHRLSLHPQTIYEDEESDADDVDHAWRPHSPRSPRMSIFSLAGRRDSDLSDVWDPMERLPHADHYRYSMQLDRLRPTLCQLREEPEAKPETLGEDLKDEKDEEEGPPPKPPSPKKGWILGVLVRCLLNIFGVMLFLRLTWITGQAGMALASVIVLLASVVTTITTTSMAAICTNGEVKGGGAYYMISRSLGPEFGGAIGVIFALANAIATAMYVVGFAETLRDLVKLEGGVITGDPLNDVRVIGVGTSVLLLGVVMIGLDFETKAQVVLLVILLISIVNFLVGTFIPPSEEKRRMGFVGYDGDVAFDNIGPDFREYEGIDYSFFKVFAIFFPAATGILAGANISGDLKNPSMAIPRGTFLAILLTTIVYVGVIWVTGSCMLRDALGTVVGAAVNVTVSLADIQSCGPKANVTCESGLHHSYGLMGVASAFRPLIYAGVFAATLSSALASLVSAPKVFQALGKDKLFPFIDFFAKDYGKNGEPRRGYFLAFVICVAMTCIGSLDLIAPIISNFFLMAYTLINFSCFDAAFANSPGFRPSFGLFNQWVSLVGALLCVVIMFMLSWWAALVTVIVVVALYVFIKNRNPDVNWGSSGQAHAYNDALKSTLKLVNVDEHVKNFRPQILALTGYPRNRPALVDFAASITKRQSLLLCAHVFQGDMQRHLNRLRSTAAYRWFTNRGVRAFYTSLAAPTLRHGTQMLMQSQGIGKLRPNTLMIGLKTDWQTVDPSTVHNYVGIIHDAFDLHYGVGVLSMESGLDLHEVTDFLLDSTDDTLEDLENEDMEDDVSEADEKELADRRRRMSTIFTEKPALFPGGDIVLKDFRRTSPYGLGPRTHFHPQDQDIDEEDEDDLEDDDDGAEVNVDAVRTNHVKLNDEMSSKSGEKVKDEDVGKDAVDDPNAHPQDRVLKGVLSKADTGDATDSNYFRVKQTGTVDVWWLCDDGGLGLLLPHILSTRKKWKQCKLRVFCAGTTQKNIADDQTRMELLLNKFRIEFSDITVLPDIRKKPRRSSFKEFEQLIYRWRLRAGETQEDFPWKVSDADLAAHKNKIYMQIKIREKLLENSKDASLIVVTLPVPRKFCPAGLYMSWLHLLTDGLPPTLLLRGNQQNVLTYVS